MENLAVTPSVMEGDLMEMSPLKQPNSILKASQKENLILLQTPVHKNLKVSFITPIRTPMQPLNKAPLQSSTLRMGSTSTMIPTALHLNSIIPESSSILSTPECNAVHSIAGQMRSITEVSVTQGKKGLVTEQKSDSRTQDGGKWEILRKLDEDLRWKDRVEVITKLDDLEYKKFALEFVHEMINNVVDISESKHSTSKEKGDICGIELPNKAVKTNQKASNLSEKRVLDQCQDPLDLQPLKQTSNREDQANKEGQQVVGDKKKRTLSALKKPMCVKKRHNMTSSRSHSTSALSGAHDAPTFKMGTKSYSFDLDGIPENSDTFGAEEPSISKQDNRLSSITKGNAMPIANHTGLRNHGVAEHAMDDSLANITTNLDTSVFSTPSQPFVNKLPSPGNQTFSDSDFVDGSLLLAQGQLDLDFLEQKTSGDIANSLRKQSLFLKFDPLLEDLSPRRSLALMGRKSDIIDFTGRVTPHPQEVEDENVVSPREPDLLCDSPSELNATENLTFDTSQMKRGSSKTDSTSSASPNVPNSAGSRPDFGIVEMLKYSEADMQRILKRKQEKWIKEKQHSDERCRKLEIEIMQKAILSDDSKTLCESHVQIIEQDKDSNDRDAKAVQAEQQKLGAMNLKLTEASRILFIESQNLQKMHASFEANQFKLNEHVKAVKAKIAVSQKNFSDLEKQLVETIQSTEIERKSVESKLQNQMRNIRSRMKSLELKARGMQTTLENKQKENQELTKICDELVTSNENSS